MKKIIFLLLLAQTISFLYGDSACMGYRKYQGADGAVSDPADKNAWRWGVKPPYKIRCDCPCMQYKQLANHTCLMCRHTRVPEDLILADATNAIVVTPTMTIKHHHKKLTHQEKKEIHKSRKKLIAVTDQ